MENDNINNKNSILDKIISSKQSQELAEFNPSEIMAGLLKILNSKERDVLVRRFGLLGRPRETLEQIGKSYQVTRERVRQIERGGVKKIKSLDSAHPNHSQIRELEDLIARLLEEHGGAMSEEHLLDNVLFNGGDHDLNRRNLVFILSELSTDRLNLIKEDEYFERGWKLALLELDLIKELLAEIIRLLEKENKPLLEDNLMELLTNQAPFHERKQKLTLPLGYNETDLERDKKIVAAYLNISKQLDKNIFDEWGLSSWRTILPKKINDKIYLILKQEGKPLHFTKISELINQAKFDDKLAYPATVHNELILDPQYILVGRGIYALKEWGYEPGTVSEAIVSLLKKEGALAKEQIIEKILKQRLVSGNTVNLALTNKNLFKKLADGKYSLAA